MLGPLLGDVTRDAGITGSHCKVTEGVSGIENYCWKNWELGGHVPEVV